MAEGIEVGGQLARLLDLACETGQGYHFARPLEARDVETFLLAGNGPDTPAKPGPGRGAAGATAPAGP